MRVISGKARGLKLTAPNGLETRPTTDRVKESIFNLLIPYLPSKSVLDLFSGSGAMGIEALSRYCEHCVFVEKSKSALEILKKNIEKARFPENSEIFHCDALSFLSSRENGFDIIFLDPPYNAGLLPSVFSLIYNRRLLNSGGVIVCETELSGETVSDCNFKCIKQAKYGKTVVSLFQLA